MKGSPQGEALNGYLGTRDEALDQDAAVLAFLARLPGSGRVCDPPRCAAVGSPFRWSEAWTRSVRLLKTTTRKRLRSTGRLPLASIGELKKRTWTFATGRCWPFYKIPT